jgi:pyruvate/2-oxoglutarate dehydrogenase complex dihydrolipoamide dehydrogenase (E3) component
MVVIGGGPAGLEAALTASRRGWDVILFERSSSLGGQFDLAFRTVTKAAMEDPFRSLVRAAEIAPIEIRLGVEADAATVLELAPDRVVVATGSRPVVPDVPGLDDPLFAADVLTGRRTLGHRVLVLGGGMVGSELAEHLATRGHAVVVVELLDEMARDMDPLTRSMLLHRFAELPIELYTRTRLLELADGEAVVRDEASGEERSLGRFESVIVAIGHTSYDPVSGVLRDAGLDVQVIGDACRPGRILDATRSGREAVVATGGE